MHRIQVLIVDDHPGYRRVVREDLEEYSADILVVGEASDGEQALTLIPQLCPDVVLMDVQMRRMNGVEATRLIRRQHPAIQVILLTNHSEHEVIVEALRAGATGYLLKESDGEDLIRAITSAFHHEAVLSPPVATKVVHELLAHPGPRRVIPHVDLTEHEIAILMGLAEGKSNGAIASHLSFSESTVQQYVKRIILKLNANNRTHAVVIAKDSGVI